MAQSRGGGGGGAAGGAARRHPESWVASVRKSAGLMPALRWAWGPRELPAVPLGHLWLTLTCPLRPGYRFGPPRASPDAWLEGVPPRGCPLHRWATEPWCPGT